MSFNCKYLRAKLVLSLHVLSVLRHGQIPALSDLVHSPFPIVFPNFNVLCLWGFRTENSLQGPKFMSLLSPSAVKHIVNHDYEYVIQADLVK
jgi:hypothetical protein